MNDNIIRVVKKLKKLNIPYRIIELGGTGRTSQDVARLTNINLREVCKTLIVRADNDTMAVVILPGPFKIDNKKLKELLKTKNTRFLNEDELKQNTPFSPGEVCPIIIEKIPIYIDKRVFDTKKVNFGSGDLYFGIEINSNDINKCIKGEVVDIAVE
ncbi:MAG: YbaK/EbsC family protein [Candidatus Aenigmarchaeota archaeon]|nr:YbaK/EbsC family protein [Candidatus Aenigmarchaeota archaeon]